MQPAELPRGEARSFESALLRKVVDLCSDLEPSPAAAADAVVFSVIAFAASALRPASHPRAWPECAAYRPHPIIHPIDRIYLDVRNEP
jgi:hypothetical protein